MKLTLGNIKAIKQCTCNKLTKDVCDYIIDEWHDYDNKKEIFTDVLYCGCKSGIVGKLIYSDDTTKYYKKYKEEINDLLYETMSETGIYSLKDLLGKDYDGKDPLIIDRFNQTLLAWFGFEETLRKIGLQFEVLENCI